ncbi:MAG: YggS family pyridoxal phosphate-dependent enzyme [Epsilonproteobacteria bacterium]|nr:MAG: YggS family pyridoxal phosphate-dependent enzyme [Campylobacterota bacterium]RLA68066.1 MAG: YggS family pyridoxal phosphate-dependent enzyme [Campylobacterota bacterium]
MTNLANIKGKLKQAELVAVTKNATVAQLMELYEEGQRDFGENRVQEIIRKEGELKDLPINWHFIGPLQRNKVKKLLKVKHLKYIHSIDSLKLIDEFIKQKGEFIGDSLGLFLEFNTSGEEEKHGFINYDDLKVAAEKIIQDLPNMNLIGLMTIGKIRGNDFKQDAIDSFSTLLEIKQKLEQDLNIGPLKLSMGMSKDFEIAVEIGSDFVRVGRYLFAPHQC